MSLLLGNLSSRVRKDDLERVFRRFGRCSIQLQLRDNFGFVFYDYPVNAERALKTLQGKKICGELLTLSWSNRQSNSRPLPSVRNELENVSEFDRYEPYSGDDRWDANEINQGGSNTAENVHRRKGVVQIVTKNTHRVCCYNCGELGHKRRNCPQNRVPKKNLNRFDHKRNDKSTRIESNSRERERPSRDAVTMRSRNQTHYSPVDNRIDNEKMKRKRESVSPERHRATKSRRSNSKNSNPTTRFASNSNLKSRSLSSSSSSSTLGSKSHSHRSRNHRSRSRSRSRSGSRSRSSSRASTSSGPSSNSLKKATSPPQKEDDTSSENPKLETNDTNDIEKCEKETTHLEIQDLRETAMVDRESDDGSRSLNRNKPIVITSEEMLMVIKHYRLKQAEGADDNESFFGCGRLWPWEVIYYRRLKKGRISNENYAQRVSQNREFGIVDKYVRSSSGWQEVEFDERFHSDVKVVAD